MCLVCKTSTRYTLRMKHAMILAGGDHMLDAEVHAAARRFLDAQTKRTAQAAVTARR